MKRQLLACLIFAISASQNLVQAETFPQPNIQLGDFWLYKYTEAKPNSVPQEGLFEHLVMWKSTRDEWIVGSRAAFTNDPQAMLPGFAVRRCLVAVGIGVEALDKEFCNGVFEVGARVARKRDDGATTETVFEGTEPVKTPAGDFVAHKFRVTDKFGPGYKDRIVPEAAERVSDWWYANEARTAVKRKLVWYDANGAVLLTRTQELVQLKLRAPTVMSPGS